MAAWCLPRDLTDKFLEAMRSGEIVPGKLAAMSSAERRAEFAKLLGDENAHEVNSQFEAKLLLNDQKAGLSNWARKLGGVTEPARRDILATISKLDRVLNPAEEQSFLEDLAAKKLGISVSADEAKAIFDLAQRAEALRAEIVASGKGSYEGGWTAESGTAFGRAQQALIEKVKSLKPEPDRLKKLAVGIYNIPRELQVGLFHFSAPFVQLWGLISTPQWYRGLRQMFDYFGSEGSYNDLYAYMLGHPNYQMARTAKLGLTNLGDKFTTAEEGLQAHMIADMVDKVSPGFNPFHMSQRAFVGTINYVRFERFNDLVSAARLAGNEVTPGSQIAADLASVVNVFSGRGPIKESWAAPLNALFYAPRKVSGTVNMFNPIYYAKLSPVARTAAMKQLAGSLVVTGAVLTLAKIAGAQVSFDPRDQKFAKIDIGGEKLDMTGGNSTYIRLLARLITNHEITSGGKDESQPGTRGEAATNFVRGKLAPVAGIIANALYGRDGAGRTFNMTDQLYESLTPIAIHSMLDFALNNPDDTAAYLPSLASFLGVSLESPLPPPSRAGMNVWGDTSSPLSTPPAWRNDPVNKEATAAGLALHFPTQKINGVKLTDAQYEEYIHLSGSLAHQRLEQVIEMPSWDSLPSGARLKIMKTVISSSRKSAQSAIMIEAQGSANDILKQSTDAKMAAMGVTAP